MYPATAICRPRIMADDATFQNFAAWLSMHRCDIHSLAQWSTMKLTALQNPFVLFFQSNVRPMWVRHQF